MVKRAFSFLPSLKRWSRLQRMLLGLAPTAPKASRAGARKTPSAATPAAAPGQTSGRRKPAATRTAKARRKPQTLASLGAGESQHLALYAKPAGANVHVRLSYTLYSPMQGNDAVPIKSLEAAPLPLMVMLHGCQQTVHDFAVGTRMNRLADKYGFAVAYPQQARTRQAHRCWRWFQPDDDSGGLEADALAILIRELLAKHAGLDATRVYAVGLSAGAGMAALLALRHPDLIAALAMHSGPVVGDASNVRTGLRTMQQGSDANAADLIKRYVAHPVPMPSIILHGMRDPVVAFRNAQQLVEQFLFINGIDPAMQATVSYLAQGKAHAYRRTDYVQERQTVVRWCELDRVEHAWSGGDESVKFNTRNGPDASLLIWRFVSAHRRLAPSTMTPADTALA